MTEPTKPLTNREWEVVKYMGRGWNYERIGRVLGISPRSVETYVLRIATKLHNPEELRPRILVMLFARDETNAA